jgi:hypothetical protein
MKRYHAVEAQWNPHKTVRIWLEGTISYLRHLDNVCESLVNIKRKPNVSDSEAICMVDVMNVWC